MIKNILFDLDGTLLPINIAVFTKAYLSELAAKVIPLGYDKDLFIKALWAGTNAMFANDGSVPNKDVFWGIFTRLLGEKADGLEDIIDTFYENEFDRLKEIQFAERDCSELVRGLKRKGFNIVLATSPIFPLAAIRTRLSWINLTPEDFDCITTYDNSSFCKINLGYYSEILDRLGFKAEESIMVGNNPVEDMSFEKLGGKVFLVTDDVENPDGVPTDCYKQGTFEELTQNIDSVIC